MNIGVIIPEVGDYSPLSLEFEKWQNVMARMGHNVYILTGKISSYFTNATVLSELYTESIANIEIYQSVSTFSSENSNIEAVLEDSSNRIQSIMMNWVSMNKIDVLIVENFLSIPMNLATSYALFKLFSKINCIKLIKHHDAFYRKSLNDLTQNEFVKKLLLSCFPVVGDNVFHIASNRLIKTYLKEKCGIDSIVIPYVVDFCDSFDPSSIKFPLAITDEFVIHEYDKLIINFSFLSPNSNIDKLISLVNQIDDPKFKLIIIVKEFNGYNDYLAYLKNLIHDNNLNHRLTIIPESMFFSFQSNKSRLNIHQLYSIAKATISLDYGVSYGQPLLFAIQHKCPLLFCPKSKLQWLEIEELGCKSIEISTEMNTFDIEKINRYINKDLDWGESNYLLFKQYYSMSLLQYLINSMLTKSV